MTDGDDFDVFYRETFPRLWAYLVRTTRERALAEELAQESFVRLLASRGASLPAGERRAYLYRIAENLVRDTARARARERTAPFDGAPEPPAPGSPGAARDAVDAAFQSLVERERKLLWLAHVEGWSHAEIARGLGLAAGSVRVLLHRARRRFREILEKGESR